MNPIDATFQRLRAEKRKGVHAVRHAGDPDLALTEQLVPSWRGAGPA